MRYNIAALTALAAGVQAFPTVPDVLASMANPDEPTHQLDSRDVIDIESRIRKNEANSGFFPNTGFNAKQQYVDTRPGSQNEFERPHKGDIRGPCPGLNAAANHNFIDHTGVIDFTDTTRGMFKAYRLGQDFAIPLFFFGTFNSGSFVDEKWSIGGPMHGATLGVLGGGKGISNSHNKYEGDSSPGRGDAFLHNGDAHTLNIPNFSQLWNDPDANGNYGMDALRRQAVRAHKFTIDNNPYAFYGPGFVVPPIAHAFIVAFMSNYSEEHVQGYLSKHTLGSFFSVTEKKNGELMWKPGYDRMPDNWYNRPPTNPYDVVASFGDLGILCSQSPQICDIGGSTGKKGDFVGVEVEDVSGGAIRSGDLLKGNNLACLGIEGLTFANPSLASKLEGATNGFLKKAQAALGATKSKLGCPAIEYSTKSFKKYPGFTWTQPLQPAQTY